MRNHSYDLHQPTDSFHDNQTHFYLKGFTQRLVLKQRHKDTFIHELLTGAFDFLINWTRDYEVFFHLPLLSYTKDRFFRSVSYMVSCNALFLLLVYDY